tara:strand:+ start:334 stop:519 length:186 start_codon:yes stop_codon:yes gene_type:complete
MFIIIVKLVKMTNDYKTLFLNIGTFTLSMTNIDVFLKIILLSVSILYTLHKWYLMNENKKE